MHKLWGAVLGAAVFAAAALLHEAIRGLEQNALVVVTGRPFALVHAPWFWVTGLIALAATLAVALALIRLGRAGRIAFTIAVATALVAGTITAFTVGTQNIPLLTPPVLWLVDGASDPAAWIALAGGILLSLRRTDGARRRGSPPS